MECATPARGSAFQLKTGHKIPKIAKNTQKPVFLKINSIKIVYKSVFFNKNTSIFQKFEKNRKTDKQTDIATIL